MRPEITSSNPAGEPVYNARLMQQGGTALARPEHYFGLHTVTSILESHPLAAISLFVLQGREDDRLTRLLAMAQAEGIAVQAASRETLDRLAAGSQHQGVVLACRPLPVADEQTLDALLARTPDALLLVLDNLTDPHNLGACLRTAAAMPVTAVIAPRDRAAGLTPVARKVAAGGAEAVPFIQVTNLARCLTRLKEDGMRVVGTALDAQAVRLPDCDLTGALAVVMGAEDTGMRRLTRELCDEVVYIPMSGRLQSLNVSVATGMVLYEASRQRLVAQ